MSRKHLQILKKILPAYCEKLSWKHSYRWRAKGKEGEGVRGQQVKNGGEEGPAEQCCQAPGLIVMKMAVHMTTMAAE